MTLRGNVIQGVLGFLGPAVIVLASYPALLRHLGAAAFGVYLLAISMSGSVVFLDLGLAAATVKFVAEDLASGRTKAAADVIVTSLVVFGATGLVAGGSLATLTATPFSDPDWLFEIKWDGYRLQTIVDAGNVRTYTRKGLDWSEKFPTLAAAAAEFCRRLNIPAYMNGAGRGTRCSM